MRLIKIRKQIIQESLKVPEMDQMHKVPPALRLYNKSEKAAEETETSPRGLGVADQPICLEDNVRHAKLLASHSASFPMLSPMRLQRSCSSEQCSSGSLAHQVGL